MFDVPVAGIPDNVIEPLFVTEQELVPSAAVRSVPAVPVILMLPAKLLKRVTGVSAQAVEPPMTAIVITSKAKSFNEYLSDTLRHNSKPVQVLKNSSLIKKLQINLKNQTRFIFINKFRIREK
jgi:hypothetical protein